MKAARKDDPPAENAAEELGDRAIYAARGATEGFQDQFAAIALLADAVAAGARNHLFIRSGKMYYLDKNGEILAVDGNTLGGIIATHVVTRLAVGTPGQSDWRWVYQPYQADQREIRTLLSAKTLREGSLTGRVMEG